MIPSPVSGVLLTLVAHAVEGSLQTERYWPAGPAAERTPPSTPPSGALVAVALVLGDRTSWWPPRTEPTGA